MGCSGILLDQHFVRIDIFNVLKEIIVDHSQVTLFIYRNVDSGLISIENYIKRYIFVKKKGFMDFTLYIVNGRNFCVNTHKGVRCKMFPQDNGWQAQKDPYST